MEEVQKSIGVVVCYFGKFPAYFDLWLKSCACNPTVDFLIYTDCEDAYKLPINVFIKKIRLEDIKRRAEEIVGFHVSLERPYRLCDFRPLFGELFKADLKKYDFWGYCDLDIIVGNIRKYITNDILESYDKINRWGHLSFHRNTEECNQRYKLDSVRYSYKEVLTRTRDFGFDEYDYTTIHKKYGFPILILPEAMYADIRARYKRFCVKGKDNYKEQVFYWENGAVFRAYLDQDGQWKSNEYLYIHFKKRGDLPVHFDESEQKTKAFYITNAGFYEKDDTITKKTVDTYNSYPGKFYEACEDMKYRMKNNVHKIKRKYFE